MCEVSGLPYNLGSLDLLDLLGVRRPGWFLWVQPKVGLASASIAVLCQH